VREREPRTGRGAGACRRARGGAFRPLRPRGRRAAARGRLAPSQECCPGRGGSDSRCDRAGEPPVLREARLETARMRLLVEWPVRAAILAAVDRMEEVVVIRASFERLLRQLRAVARLREI